mgnify:CR=1 FL=1
MNQVFFLSQQPTKEDLTKDLKNNYWKREKARTVHSASRKGAYLRSKGYTTENHGMYIVKDPYNAYTWNSTILQGVIPY